MIQKVNKSSSVCVAAQQLHNHTLSLLLRCLFFFFFTAVGSEGNNVSTTSPPRSSAGRYWLAERRWTARLGRRRWRWRWWKWGAGRGRCNEFVLMVSVAQRHCNTNSSVNEQQHCCDCEALLLYEPRTQSSSVSPAEPSKPPG